MTVVNEAEIRKPHETLQERLAQVVELLERYDLAVEAREDQDRAPVSPADIPEEGLEELRARLDELHPADVAFILEALPQEDRLTVWGLVKTERDGEILLEVSDAVRETLTWTIRKSSRWPVNSTPTNSPTWRRTCRAMSSMS